MQARSDLSAAKKRVKESEERVDVKLPEYVKKKYWCVLAAQPTVQSHHLLASPGGDSAAIQPGNIYQPLAREPADMRAAPCQREARCTLKAVGDLTLLAGLKATQ